jgi:hypothetical protein
MPVDCREGAMSEYQYYEFQAINRPLTDEEQAILHGYSPGVPLSPRRGL